jgi:hypothetical protein
VNGRGHGGRPHPALRIFRQRISDRITRIALAFEAGRDGFRLARWLEARGVEAHVIHPSSVAVSRVRVPVEGDHRFRWKMITQSGGT